MLVEGLVSRRWTAAAIWASLAAGGAYLYWFEPGKTGFFPSCPFRALTGFNCPGCGTTRALHQLLHGNVVAAFGVSDRKPHGNDIGVDGASPMLAR